ncbi:MAG: hypothetical protein QW146_09185, partial [Candidatus Bathyarchaeia archaeon]
IVGLGEVGRALFELFKESGKFDAYGFDIDEAKMRGIVGDVELPSAFDVMHICYPCTDQKLFVNVTLDYMRRFKPKLTIIDSTVPPGTTQKIYEETKSLVAHSPVRGMHRSLETMKRDIMFWTKYVGGATQEAAELAKRHFEKLGLKVKVLKSPVETELAKLFETIYRAWMIVCFQEMHRISRHFGADFNEVVDMIEDIHRVHFNKPLHYPGVIGGHCLIPNTELLLKAYKSEFLRLILKSNEKRKKEIEDAQVKEEVEKVRKRVESLEKEIRNITLPKRLQSLERTLNQAG